MQPFKKSLPQGAREADLVPIPSDFLGGQEMSGHQVLQDKASPLDPSFAPLDPSFAQKADVTANTLSDTRGVHVEGDLVGTRVGSEALQDEQPPSDVATADVATADVATADGPRGTASVGASQGAEKSAELDALMEDDEPRSWLSIRHEALAAELGWRIGDVTEFKLVAGTDPSKWTLTVLVLHAFLCRHSSHTHETVWPHTSRILRIMWTDETVAAFAPAAAGLARILKNPWQETRVSAKRVSASHYDTGGEEAQGPKKKTVVGKKKAKRPAVTAVVGVAQRQTTFPQASNGRSSKRKSKAPRSTLDALGTGYMEAVEEGAHPLSKKRGAPEVALATRRSRRARPPPGYHAHLTSGMEKSEISIEATRNEDGKRMRTSDQVPKPAGAQRRQDAGQWNNGGALKSRRLLPDDDMAYSDDAGQR